MPNPLTPAEVAPVQHAVGDLALQLLAVQARIDHQARVGDLMDCAELLAMLTSALETQHDIAKRLAYLTVLAAR